MGCASVATLDGVKRRQSRGASSLAALTIKFCENLIDGEKCGWRTVRDAVGAWDEIALGFGRGHLFGVSAGSRGMQADGKYDGRHEGRRAKLRRSADAVSSRRPQCQERPSTSYALIRVPGCYRDADCGLDRLRGVKGRWLGKG